jgi:hypothetical protein
MAGPSRRHGALAGAVTASTTITVARTGHARRRIPDDEVGEVSTTAKWATHQARSWRRKPIELAGQRRGAKSGRCGGVSSSVVVPGARRRQMRGPATPGNRGGSEGHDQKVRESSEAVVIE